MTNPATRDAPQIVKHWTESEPVRLAAHRAGRVYLAGPMTGLPEFNFPAFNAEAASLRADGLVVINPAEHGIVEGAEWADYLRHDLAGLMSCERIHLLRGWHDSKGARLEVHAAKALGMQITYQDGATLAKCDGNHGGPRCADPECWNDSAPASDPLKDNQIAALINKVCRLAREFHNHDSLRQRIAQELVPALKQASGQPAAAGVSDAACVPEKPLGKNWHAHYVLLDKAALQMIRNALRNDVERGLKVRGEMLDELDRAILALRPQAAPMTRAQRLEVFRKAEDRMAHDINLCWRDALIEETEAHFGITVQGAQEGV